MEATCTPDKLPVISGGLSDRHVIRPCTNQRLSATNDAKTIDEATATRLAADDAGRNKTQSWRCEISTVALLTHPSPTLPASSPPRPSWSHAHSSTRGGCCCCSPSSTRSESSSSDHTVLPVWSSPARESEQHFPDDGGSTLAGRATDEQQQQRLLGIDEEIDTETIDFIFSHELRQTEVETISFVRTDRQTDALPRSFCLCSPCVSLRLLAGALAGG